MGKIHWKCVLLFKRLYYFISRSLKSLGLTRLQCFMVLPCFWWHTWRLPFIILCVVFQVQLNSFKILTMKYKRNLFSYFSPFSEADKNKFVDGKLHIAKSFIIFDRLFKNPYEYLHKKAKSLEESMQFLLSAYVSYSNLIQMTYVVLRSYFSFVKYPLQHTCCSTSSTNYHNYIQDWHKPVEHNSTNQSKKPQIVSSHRTSIKAFYCV